MDAKFSSSEKSARGRMPDPYGILGPDPPSEEELLAVMLATVSQGEIGWGILGKREDEKMKEKMETGREAKEAKAGMLKVGRLKPVRAKPDTCAGSGPAPLEDNLCPSCSGRMCVQDLEYRCESCGIVAGNDFSSVEDAEEGPKPLPGRLRVVGPRSGFYQSDLDRSSSGDSEASQHKQLLDEFIALRQTYLERRKAEKKKSCAFPIDALEKAADHYQTIRKVVCKRSLNKKAIMAACLKLACASIGLAPDKAEFAEMMQLQTRGIAKGENYLRTMESNGYIEMEVNPDMCRPNIVTTFTQLGLADEKYEHLRRAVEEIVDISVKENIGTSSIMPSKVKGATLVVLRRQALAEGRDPMSVQQFCEACGIRRSTIERFTCPLNDHHSFFVEVYKRAGVYSAPEPGLARRTADKVSKRS